MKTKFANIAKNLLPVLFGWLKKQAQNKKESKLKDAGIAAIEIEQAANKIIEASKDGVIDEQELKTIAIESSEALIAAAKLFMKIEIKVKKKK